MLATSKTKVLGLVNLRPPHTHTRAHTRELWGPRKGLGGAAGGKKIELPAVKGARNKGGKC